MVGGDKVGLAGWHLIRQALTARLLLKTARSKVTESIAATITPGSDRVFQILIPLSLVVVDCLRSDIVTPLV